MNCENDNTKSRQHQEQFEKAAKEIFSPDLRKNLANASEKFVEAGLSKLQ